MSANIPLACTLSDADLQARSGVVEELFGHATQVEELEDGYAFAFPSGSEWAHQLLDFADFERMCCPFFSFSLRFPSPHEAIWLDVCGEAPKVKEMIRTGFRARAVNAA